MLLNKKNNSKIVYFFFIATPLVLMVIFSYTIKAASNYNDCYDKKKSNQKSCLQSEYNKACEGKTGNKKENCQKDESAKLDSAFDGAVSQCASKNNLTKSECKDGFVKPVNVGGYVSSQSSDSGDESTGSETQPLPNEAATQAYSCDGLSKQECLEKNPIVKWINWGINLVAGIVGVGAVLMIIWAGIQYTTARDNAQAVAAAKQKIINVVIGIAAFIFLYAFLNWLVPGGVFK